MRTILITSCSNRKSIPAHDRLQAGTLPEGSLLEVSRAWRKRLKEHPIRVKAGDLYVGRGASEARLVVSSSCTEHWIVSAGLGLVPSEQYVPAYDLTVSGDGSNQIKRKVPNESFIPQSWWWELAKQRRPSNTIARLIEKNQKSLFVIALPSNYLKMVADDLDNVPGDDLRRVRILGAPNNAVPPKLKTLWMPYDKRFDGPKSPNPGTASDFPQRAARHFIETIVPRIQYPTANKHAKAVENALAKLPFPTIPKRRKVDDAELLQIIETLWNRAEGKSGRMLRILRDEEQIACEQGRFKDLFNYAKTYI